ncbi:hypothetical protein DL93DRAFT_2137021 [Clavulina sp. PMI_390]|nr:hypothetical protein DL93DRAFT_2137021 [Clavulina sp. PMI_390]
MAIFSLTPTFTQGFILGQASILALMYLIFRYLFFENTPLQSESDVAADEVTSDAGGGETEADLKHTSDFQFDVTRQESLGWFNLLLDGIAKAYRADLRGNLPGAAGNRAAQRSIERWVQGVLQTSVLSPARVHAVSLGKSAPQLSNGRIRRNADDSCPHIEFDISYDDSVSLTLSTSFLFNYPTAFFARLPISITLSLSIFSGKLILIPPTPDTPTFTLRLDPSFKLALNQSSQMGSRAQLANVPKVHEMIEARIRASIASRLAEYRIVLPGIRNRSGGGGGGSTMSDGETEVDDEESGEGSIPGTPAGMLHKTVDVYVEK